MKMPLHCGNGRLIHPPRIQTPIFRPHSPQRFRLAFHLSIHIPTLVSIQGSSIAKTFEPTIIPLRRLAAVLHTGVVHLHSVHASSPHCLSTICRHPHVNTQCNACSVCPHCPYNGASFAVITNKQRFAFLQPLLPRITLLAFGKKASFSTMSWWVLQPSVIFNTTSQQEFARQQFSTLTKIQSKIGFVDNYTSLCVLPKWFSKLLYACFAQIMVGHSLDIVFGIRLQIIRRWSTNLRRIFLYNK